MKTPAEAVLLILARAFLRPPLRFLIAPTSQDTLRQFVADADRPKP